MLPTARPKGSVQPDRRCRRGRSRYSVGSGGQTRTDDLRVMSPTSTGLLHPASYKTEYATARLKCQGGNSLTAALKLLTEEFSVCSVNCKAQPTVDGIEDRANLSFSSGRLLTTIFCTFAIATLTVGCDRTPPPAFKLL